MNMRSKRYQDLAEEFEETGSLSPRAALKKIKNGANANFSETIECHIKLDIDPRQAEQQFRDSLVLPEGTGQDVKVIVFAQGEKAQEAEEAGADEVGGEELVEKVKEGWFDFDSAIATPDMMSEVGKLGPQLGPRGLMPNNKAGTVTFDVATAIEKIKKGQLELRNDDYGIIHTIVGTDAMSLDELTSNLKTILKFIIEQKPPAAGVRGQYISSISLTSTMSPSVEISPTAAWELE